MKNNNIFPYWVPLLAFILSTATVKAQNNSMITLGTKSSHPMQTDMLIRISEIEIVPEYLEEYKSILQTEASASVKIEPGVVAIFPMYEKENPTQIRILEIYANQAAYKSHLQTPHFQLYKTSTLKMVKSLKLVDMTDIDKETMVMMFKKLNH